MQPGVGRVGDVLLHRRGIDGNPLEAVALHPARAFAGFERPGQQPFAPFLADPVASAAERHRVNRQTVKNERIGQSSQFGPGR